MGHLDGKGAIVTGGSKGLGADIAVTLAEAGAVLAIIGRDVEGLHATQRLIEKNGGRCFIIQADLKEVSAIEKASKEILAINQSWDILVNNAGIAKKMPLVEASIDDWDDHYELNLRAPFLLTKYIVPQMIQRKSGKIINISTMGTFFGTPGFGAYAASKAGLNQLTKTMAVEWGSFNIQVNAICPTIIWTDMGKQVWDNPENKSIRDKIENRIPLKRFLQTKEVADLVLFLAGSGSSFINGTIIPVDDGAHVNPG